MDSVHFLLFLISAYLMGGLAAVPAGPVQIEVVRRAINGHVRPSLVVVLGAFLVDVLYGLIAFFGIAPVLEQERVMRIFWFLGGLLLIVIGTTVVRGALKKDDNLFSSGRLKRKRWALLGGVSLSAANPLMVIWWLSGARIFTDIGLITEFNARVAWSFLIAGSLGLASYLSVLALFVSWAKKFISSRGIRNINLGFGLFLLLIAAYFVLTSLHSLLRAA